jgi:hypothetical protein
MQAEENLLSWEQGAKPLGNGFTAVPVRENRGALLWSFGNERMDLGVVFLRASDVTGQTLETLALPTDAMPERIVGVPLKSYVSFTGLTTLRRTTSVRIKTFLWWEPISTLHVQKLLSSPAGRCGIVLV